ncbi:dTDP-glucose pyrophosphorylase [Photobacterium galatheae]|uniref:dTDP-glucose pyrophosphorylase n=1 Tax=Photobacterium galatheae TaxID=1654360 RepID=A0A066RM20_9GAMM|nr:dTDP-glucose pyrophosphorylase [Photobacterium galatheae]KDM91399.1 dTDP-glucose pyrophosphorylase [Photobacterium galatheae]MCM0151658.1 dTDP-glucose pyrophosphorylase [Photobacterium galatheae]
MATGLDERTGLLIDGVAELKQRLQRCMRTRKSTLPLSRGYGSNLPHRIDRKINPELEMDLYADVADMIADPLNGFTDEIKLNRVWLERGDNRVFVGVEVTLRFDGSVEKISGLSV